MLPRPAARLDSRVRVSWRSSRSPWPHWAKRAPKRFTVVFDGVALGEGTVSSYGREDWRTARASISLFTPVDDERWEKAGGWHGFSVALGGAEGLGVTPDEVRSVVESALGSGEADLTVGTSYEETLTMLVSADRVFVMYLAEGGGDWRVAVDPGGPDRPVAFTLDNGQVDEFDGRSTVDHPRALAALDAFLAGRGPAPELGWSDEA